MPNVLQFNSGEAIDALTRLLHEGYETLSPTASGSVNLPKPSRRSYPAALFFRQIHWGDWQSAVSAAAEA